MSLQRTILPPRADLIQNDFDKLIDQKGNEAIVEKAFECPCRGKAQGSPIPSCKNCGGSGWVFINPRATRIVVQNISIVNEYRPWSEELRGTVKISCKASEELTVMDRITIVNGESIHTEVVYPRKLSDAQYFVYVTYPIKSIDYIAGFDGADQPLNRLIKNVDYTIDETKPYVLVLLNSQLFDDAKGIVVRYNHAPQFHIIEMSRETMQTFQWNGKEKLTHLPLSGIGKRAHFQINRLNLNGGNVIDNSYE